MAPSPSLSSESKKTPDASVLRMPSPSWGMSRGETLGGNGLGEKKFKLTTRGSVHSCFGSSFEEATAIKHDSKDIVATCLRRFLRGR
mmetsp:Transcript_1684/g.3604  ORF Transcript_1684/g.3604 Transcript_1684/m.3604 type:complete len:87 (+) Transcript_1684:1892-2152(+)